MILITTESEVARIRGTENVTWPLIGEDGCLYGETPLSNGKGVYWEDSRVEKGMRNA